MESCAMTTAVGPHTNAVTISTRELERRTFFVAQLDHMFLLLD